jgi:hypothetical protein
VGVAHQAAAAGRAAVPLAMLVILPRRSCVAGHLLLCCCGRGRRLAARCGSASGTEPGAVRRLRIVSARPGS